MTISRRGFITTGAALGLGAAVGAASPRGLLGEALAAPAADPPGDLLHRLIPRTEERVPAIGLGTFMTFDLLPGRPRRHLHGVLDRFWRAGGRVVDTSPLYGTSEVNVGDLAGALGIGERLFVANKIWSTGEHLFDPSHARRSLDTTLGRLWRQRVDVMQCHSLVNVDAVVPLLQRWKREGLVRYVGITHHEPAYFDLLTSWIAKGGIDFVQVHYSIHTRAAERRLLPAAAKHGTAVLVNMPLEKARLPAIVEGRPLPGFAGDLGVTTWAQYFLKWVISHPAVTCALPATSSVAHVADNMAAGRGPMPDRTLRERMVRHMEEMPAFARLGRMPWYPGKRYDGLVARAQRTMRGR